MARLTRSCWPSRGSSMRHGSLFSGYGGLDRAIADVFGAETAYCSDYMSNGYHRTTAVCSES